MLHFSCSAVLLAGGQSIRMGADKAELMLNENPLWIHQLAKLRQLPMVETLVSARPGTLYQAADCKCVHDSSPGSGPLGGIAAALAAINTDALLVLAVDMPDITVEFLRGLLQRAALTQKGVIPRVAGKLEPLAAIYLRESMSLADEMLAAGRLRMQEFAQTLVSSGAATALELSEEEMPLFCNLNTPHDVAAWKAQRQR